MYLLKHERMSHRFFSFVFYPRATACDRWRKLKRGVTWGGQNVSRRNDKLGLPLCPQQQRPVFAAKTVPVFQRKLSRGKTTSQYQHLTTELTSFTGINFPDERRLANTVSRAELPFPADGRGYPSLPTLSIASTPRKRRLGKKWSVVFNTGGRIDIEKPLQS